MTAQTLQFTPTARVNRQNGREHAANASLARLRAAETAIEEAYSATADLAAELPRLRADAHLATVVGHPALEEVSRTIGHLTAALDGIGRTHGQLAQVARQVGVRPRMEGIPDKPPEEPGPDKP